eukprot:11668116-Karenia_brevis.AAC.1
MAAVRAIKESPEYNSSDFWRPTTPNPNRREISKRQWECSVMRWRNDLRLRFREAVPAGCEVLRSCDWVNDTAAQGSSIRKHGVPDFMLLPIDQISVPAPTPTHTDAKMECVATASLPTNAQNSTER